VVEDVHDGDLVLHLLPLLRLTATDEFRSLVIFSKILFLHLNYSIRFKNDMTTSCLKYFRDQGPYSQRFIFFETYEWAN
jgi:hypothetical protein